jgi:hypothetical protein
MHTESDLKELEERWDPEIMNLKSFFSLTGFIK